MIARKIVAVFFLSAGLCAALAGCAAPMDASKARSRAVIESGGIVPAQELRVAEYLNYYEQHFPEPTAKPLGLDLRLGNPQVPTAGGETWLQIGLQARSAKPEDIAPLNLAMVIDSSGSMNTPEKMPYVKQSLRVFLGSLAANDIVSIIAYDDRPKMIAPARVVGDGQWIDIAISRLEPGGRTNLHDGLMAGFQEVDRNFDIHRNNRVILLTDGIANVGVTEPDQIAAGAKAYNERGIYLSTIGLGSDFNDALLSRLAIQGHGTYHFVDSAEEMDKVFRNDVLGLVQKIAGDVSLDFSPETGVQVTSLTGYAGRPPAGSVQINLRDMGTGDSQVLLVQMTVAPGAVGQRRLATVGLRFTDIVAQRIETVTLPVLADALPISGHDALWDVEVLRNVTIQRTAEGLKEISRLYGERRYTEAWNLARALEQDLRRVAGLTGEEQMIEDADLLQTYQGTLARWMQTVTDGGSEGTDDPQPTQFYRSRRSATPSVPVIEVK